jgi:hypothetical protein
MMTAVLVWADAKLLVKGVVETGERTRPKPNPETNASAEFLRRAILVAFFGS